MSEFVTPENQAELWGSTLPLAERRAAQKRTQAAGAFDEQKRPQFWIEFKSPEETGWREFCGCERLAIAEVYCREMWESGKYRALRIVVRTSQEWERWER